MRVRPGALHISARPPATASRPKRRSQARTSQSTCSTSTPTPRSKTKRSDGRPRRVPAAPDAKKAPPLERFVGRFLRRPLAVAHYPIFTAIDGSHFVTYITNCAAGWALTKLFVSIVEQSRYGLGVFLLTLLPRLNRLSHLVLRWPLLVLVYALVGVELILYFLLRTLVAALELAVASPTHEG